MGQPPVSQGIGPVDAPVTLDANTESFLASFCEPQWGHVAPRQRLDDTSFSNSRSQS
jgi:hypothetical protein